MKDVPLLKVPLFKIRNFYMCVCVCNLLGKMFQILAKYTLYDSLRNKSAHSKLSL